MKLVQRLRSWSSAWVTAGLLLSGVPALSWAALSAAEVAQLGSSLTPFGAERAGNADGSIPPYTGGLPVSTQPAGFQKGSGRWVDPFAADKPLYSVTAQTADRHAPRLSETAKALFKRYPGYRMDVYPSRRSVAYPDWVLDNTRKNATRAKTTNAGVTLEDAHGGVPFPMPKTGHEAMWNHLLRYNGLGYQYTGRNWYVTPAGLAVNSGALRVDWQSLYQDPAQSADDTRKAGNYFSQSVYDFIGPAQAVGNATLYNDTLDPVAQPRRAWTYSAATRRTRVAPDVSYATPVASQGGVMSYDEVYLFQGALDMFDYKLLGKREMLIPYNGYALSFGSTSKALLTPQYLNPNFVRWELHRVWVVEATLKPGKSHTVSRRMYYFDEDWSGAGMSDGFDAAGRLARGQFLSSVQLYDEQTPVAITYWGYDLSSGLYALVSHLGDPGSGLWSKNSVFSPLVFTPDALPTRSQRR